MSGRRALSGLTVVIAALVAWPAAARATCPATLAGDEVCIDQPPVGAPLTTTQYQLTGGTRVKLRADGCVNTGAGISGAGAGVGGWKRYVDPDPDAQGQSQNPLFQGSAAITPLTGGGNTLGQTDFANIDPAHVYRVPAGATSLLKLGYDDDFRGFGDNGYTNHDDGYDGQCVTSLTGPMGGPPGNLFGPDGYGGPAYVVVTIDPNKPPVATASSPGTWVGGVTTLNGSATDPESDGITYAYFVDDHQEIPSLFDTRVFDDGQHVYRFRATDSYGAVDEDTVDFGIDNTPPTVSVTSGPDGGTYGPGDTLTWTLAGADGTGSGVRSLRCQLDSNAPVACTSGTYSVSGLAGGPHTLLVQAFDALYASTVVSRSFTIDATPPDTAFGGGPADGYTAAAAESLRYTFTSEPGATFQCRVYQDVAGLAPPGFSACTGADFDVVSGLAAGAYVIEAQARDTAGNLDPTPAARHFTVLPAPATPAAMHKLAIPAVVVFAYSSAVKLTKLQLKHVPKGSTVTLSCKGKGCPKALKKPYTTRKASGTVSFARFTKRPFKAGVTLAFAITNPAWLTTTKRLTFRARKAPVLR